MKGSRYYQSPYGTVDPYGGYKYKIENSYQKYPSYVPSSKGKTGQPGSKKKPSHKYLISV